MNKKFLKRLEKDLTEIANVKYDDLPTEEEWLIIQNECDKYDDFDNLDWKD